MSRDIRIASGGASLRVDTGGEGPSAILLHAGVADRRMWREALPPLSQSFRATAYDRRGFGETVAPNEPFRHIDDLRRVITHLGGDAPVLVGCSQGGRVAIDYALAYPGDVAGLVLVAPAITGAPQPDAYPPQIGALLADLDDAEARNDAHLVNEIEAHLWLDGPLRAKGRVVGDARDLFLDMNAIALRHPALTHEQPSPDAIDRLHQIATPTLVIWGDLDFPHLQQRSRRLAETVPAAQSLVMTGCAHLPNMEQPETFNNAVTQFLEEATSARQRA
ncbi:MAG: alpha/beta hydrolase [Hyphomonadaceae bacterium]|nr:MAG: alpha/beta hydrolase [Caulobacteraceae bacterium]MBT9444578.1 alpha/beta hydrolase [Hyphomonadaceae bacterium]TPW03247.1 MAG: alpha/beta hydrolase [Alphaproteobacteria bacterium]